MVPMKRKLVHVPDDPAADCNENIDAAPATGAPPAAPAAPAAPAGAEAWPEAQDEASPGKRGRGGGDKNKVNTSMLELVCLVMEQGQQQIFSFQAGQPGGCSRNQIV